ncbi:MAG TPA: ATP-binding protein, partial [Thermoanaerobaculia bacterium]|nr:ATP-binding protein [Thermoanaerobaculia bacterium]
DDAYDRFLAMLASQIGTAIVSARAYEEAQARAEALAELDRLKTAFFSNVSHEFRTPLTLMLGPTEEAMASQDRALSGEDLETVYRNQLRLLKLVNTLLDFSRIEAGRATACFEPTDLATVTAHLASAFRSAVERAGLALVVRCPPLPEPVWVDRSLWEKVVLNLLSNALKFTFEGRIEVALGWRGDAVELVVRDTGVGIAPDQLAHVFDRFHRVSNARARTQEGSGIGLALVRELVGMHGGTIEVESRVGEGTAFRVTIPAGRAHLPADQVAESPPGERPASGAPAFVEEALRWLPGEPEREPPPAPANDSDVRILVADDNADMRAYLARLLGERWSVETVGDGLAAWEAIRRAPPDLVVTDVMMPGLDGFELLHRLREDERTRAVPVIVLSARAGEESRVEGLDAGADDYLVKPFSAREIVARIQAQLVRGKVRTVEEAHSRRLASVFAQAPVAVAILRGPEHVFELANPRYVELVGGREVAGKPVREALPELAGQGIYELLDRVYRSGEPHIGRALHVRVRQGPELVDCFFDFVYQPLVGDDGAVSGIAVVVYEVSELVRARRDAEAASRAKDDFLAMLGHELRNPLAPILTALELMRLRGSEEGKRERAVIERQVKHLVGLVDDLLDVSRIARGGVALARRRVEVAEFVARAVEMTAPAIEERRHELTLDVPRGLAVDGDPRRLAQVIANLLANAAKYTDPGGRIAVEARPDGEEAEIVVADTGVGIDPEILPHVFDLFVQERQPIDRSQGGLGLGLAIVHSLVAAHGGRVAAESEGRGRGSRLIVRLPLAAEASAEPPAATESAPAAASEGLSLLVVDDNRDAAEMLAHALRHLGHEVRVALDGPSALALLSTFPADAAILDLGLPVMDGYELAERLRADERTAGLRLIALTGYGRPDDQERSRAAGFEGHLVKPANAKTLDRVLRQGRRGG